MLGSGAAEKTFMPTSDIWFYVIGIGILTAIAQGAIALAYRTADAAYIQPFDHIKMPLNILAGFIVFGYFPTGNFAIGASIIILASLFVMQHEARKLRAENA